MSRKNIITLILALVALTAGAQRLRVGERSSGMEKETLLGKCKQNAKQYSTVLCFILGNFAIKIEQS